MRGRGGGRSGLLFLLAARPGRTSSGTEPVVSPVGVEFLVLEFWSLEKLFLPHCFSSPLMGQILSLLALFCIPSCLPGKETLVCSKRWHGEHDSVPSLSALQ